MNIRKFAFSIFLAPIAVGCTTVASDAGFSLVSVEGSSTCQVLIYRGNPVLMPNPAKGNSAALGIGKCPRYYPGIEKNTIWVQESITLLSPFAASVVHQTQAGKKRKMTLRPNTEIKSRKGPFIFSWYTYDA